jgi:hypothetical protein
MVTTFCVVVPNICGSLVGSSLHVTLQEPGILRWLLDFWKICVPLSYTHVDSLGKVVAEWFGYCADPEGRWHSMPIYLGGQSLSGQKIEESCILTRNI